MYNWHDVEGIPYTFWEEYGYNIKISTTLFMVFMIGMIIGEIIKIII